MSSISTFNTLFNKHVEDTPINNQETSSLKIVECVPVETEVISQKELDTSTNSKTDMKLKMSGVHCEKCNTINPTSEIFNGICKTCIEVRKAEEHDKFKTPKKDFEYILVRAIKDIGLFMGVDLKHYTLMNQDMALIPEINSRGLIKKHAVKLVNVGGMS